MTQRELRVSLLVRIKSLALACLIWKENVLFRFIPRKEIQLLPQSPKVKILLVAFSIIISFSLSSFFRFFFLSLLVLLLRVSVAVV